MSGVRALSLVLGFFVLGAGCGESPPEEAPDCSGIDSGRVCDAEGDQRCGPRGVERCEADSEGCLSWQVATTCGPHQECEGDGVCACRDECAVGGERSCEGDVIVQCVRDADGCLYLEGEVNCGGTGRSCSDEGEDGPECVGCAGDRCDEVGATRCRRQVVQRCALQDDGCLDWENVEDCGAREPAHFCSEETGEALCVEECHDNCDEPGASRCEGRVIEVCAYQEYGCLDWEDREDCGESADWCDDSGEVARCRTCDHGCEEVGASRCDGSVVESCVADEHGCRAWEPGTDCSTLDPVQRCEQDDGHAECVELEATGSCAAPIVVDKPHALYAGVDFMADFDNDQHLQGTGCVSADPTSDAVFAVDLLAGQTLRVRETGDLDAVLSLQRSCGDLEPCEFSEDTFEETGYDYSAVADERVYVIVETFEPEPRTLDYEIHIDIIEEEQCDTETDEDADGRAGCDDVDCFGLPPCDIAETNCSDGGDNDGDGQADCLDPDCADSPACGPYRGVYQVFEISDTIDLVGRTVTFTPDETETQRYRIESAPAASFPEVPGSGLASETLELDDNDIHTQVFSVLPSVTFYGESYSTMYINSNGYVSFVDWSLSVAPSLDDFFAYPTVAGLMTDLTPALPSTEGDPVVTVDEYADRIVVTFEAVPIWYDEFFGFIEGPNDFQMAISEDGTVKLTWLDISALDAIVGVGNGVGRGEYPAQTDLVP